MVDDYLLVAGSTWIVLQILTLWQMRGWWRKAARLPAAAMGLAIGVAVLGGLAGSNLAPIWIFLALPVCLSWIVLLWVVRGATWIITR